MKSLLMALSVCLFSTTIFAQNVSTGIGAVGSIDNWKVSTSTPATGPAYVVPLTMFAGIWETVPVTGTNAKWISVTPAGTGIGKTDYFYERSFPVYAGIKEVKCNFRVAADDVLKKIELVDGSGAAYNIPFTISPSAYKFTNLVTGSVKCPPPGDWKLRITIFCGDPKNFKGPTALLVSGNIDQIRGECCIIPDQKCNPMFSAAPFAVNSQGNIVINVNPVITAGSTHYWGLSGASGLGDNTPIPLATILSGGSFGLGISSNGVATPIGMGTGITASTSGYGYQYSGVSFGQCFKITHYIKCCDKWYSQTNTYCTRLCTDVKESASTEIPATAEINNKVRVIEIKKGS